MENLHRVVEIPLVQEEEQMIAGEKKQVEMALALQVVEVAVDPLVAHEEGELVL